MSGSDIDLSELGELLERFEFGAEFEKFRDTAIYSSLKFNYELHLHADSEDRRVRHVEVVGV